MVFASHDSKRGVVVESVFFLLRADVFRETRGPRVEPPHEHLLARQILRLALAVLPILAVAALVAVIEERRRAPLRMIHGQRIPFRRILELHCLFGILVIDQFLARVPASGAHETVEQERVGKSSGLHTAPVGLASAGAVVMRDASHACVAVHESV